MRGTPVRGCLEVSGERDPAPRGRGCGGVVVRAFPPEGGEDALARVLNVTKH